MTYKDLLDPANLADIKDYNLLAKTAANGLLSGLHKSLIHGKGTEFFQYKSYTPGEDIKFVDWKVYAKRNQLVTKTFETETNTSCYVVIDNSASMSYQGSRSSCSKLRYAGMTAAILAYLAIHQGDSIGLAIYSHNITEWLEPNSSMGQLDNFMKILVRIKPEGQANHSANWKSLTRKLPGRGIIIFISDMLDEEINLPSLLKFANTWRYDCLALQILDPDEIDFPFKGGITFEDLENKKEVTTAPEISGSHYIKKIKDSMNRLKVGLHKVGADYHLITTDTNLGFALKKYLHLRENRH